MSQLTKQGKPGSVAAAVNGIGWRDGASEADVSRSQIVPPIPNPTLHDRTTRDDNKKTQMVDGSEGTADR